MFLLAVNLRPVDQKYQFFYDWVDPCQTLAEQDQILDDNLLYMYCALAITKCLQKGCLKLRGHWLSCVSKFRLYQLKSKENLKFQILWELVINDSDESTTNLNDLFSDGSRLCEIKNVLECKCSVCSDLNLTVHDGSLYVVNDTSNAKCIFKYHKYWHFFLIQMFDS